MAESVVSGVATRLGNLLEQEAKFLYGVSAQVQQLQTELKRMQCFLKEADARQHESEIVMQGVAEMRDLAYDAEDIIATYALKVASNKGGGVQKALKRFTCILGEGITVHQVGSKIADIMKKLSNLRKSFEDNGIRESIMQGRGPGSLNETQREQRETYPHPERIVVGLEDDTNKLVAFLLKEEGVASICGMGGLGKTTLAKMVYNHHQVKRHFDRRAWVYISQQFQRRRVWEDILISLLSPSKDQRDDIRTLNNAMLVEKIRQVQQEQTCLVILDDIWKIEDWNILREVFPMENTDSKILLSSRNKNLALYVDPRGLHELQCLNNEKSWELLEKIAISWRSVKKRPKLKSRYRHHVEAAVEYGETIDNFHDLVDPQTLALPFLGPEPSAYILRAIEIEEKNSITKTKMEKLGKEMIGYCGGLPLAITILGGLLAAKQIEEWEDVLRHVKSYLYEQPDLRLTKVMGLSYDDLPCHLKPCFLYLAHFPEDFEIPRKELTRMWMGEGFISQIQHRGGREDTMEDVGERYLQELVQRCMVQVGKNGSLGKIRTCRIHDLMREFCVSKAQRENFLQITNIPSVESNARIGKIRRLAINLESSDNYLEGLKFNKYPYLRSLLYFVPHDNNLYLKESYFKKIRLLRVLNLENFHYYCGNLPYDIGYLIHLRFLSLKNTKIEIVPSSMGNLKCLETLDLRTQEYGMKVPNVFKNMKQLRHLYLPIYYRVSEKLELSNLHYLQTLVNVIPESIHIPSSFRFNRLRSLRTTTFLNEWEWDSDVVQVVSSCPDIYKLNLHRLIKKLPKAHQFSPNLAKLTLWRTGLEEDPMATLEKLSNLKILRLLFNSFLGKNMVCSQRGFPLLQSLVLSELRYLEEWKVYEGAAPNLLHLEIRECWCLMTIPDGLSFIATLQKLEINDMPKSFKDRLDKGGLDFYKVQRVPSLVFQQCDRE